MIKCSFCSFATATTQGLREKPSCCGKKRYVCPKCGREMIVSKENAVTRVVGNRQAIHRVKR